MKPPTVALTVPVSYTVTPGLESVPPLRAPLAGLRVKDGPLNAFVLYVLEVAREKLPAVPALRASRVDPLVSLREE